MALKAQQAAAEEKEPAHEKQKTVGDYEKDLKSKNPKARAEAAEAIGKLDSFESVSALAKALDRETDPEAKQAIIKALRKIGEGSSEEKKEEPEPVPLEPNPLDIIPGKKLDGVDEDGKPITLDEGKSHTFEDPEEFFAHSQGIDAFAGMGVLEVDRSQSKAKPDDKKPEADAKAKAKAEADAKAKADADKKKADEEAKAKADADAKKKAEADKNKGRGRR